MRIPLFFLFCLEKCENVKHLTYKKTADLQMPRKVYFSLYKTRSKETDILIGRKQQEGKLKYCIEEFQVTYTGLCELPRGYILGYWGPFGNYVRSIQTIPMVLERNWNYYHQRTRAETYAPECKLETKLSRDFQIMELSQTGECLFDFHESFQGHFSYSLLDVRKLPGNLQPNCMVVHDSSIVVIKPIKPGEMVLCDFGLWKIYYYDLKDFADLPNVVVDEILPGIEVCKVAGKNKPKKKRGRKKALEIEQPGQPKITKFVESSKSQKVSKEHEIECDKENVIETDSPPTETQNQNPVSLLSFESQFTPSQLDSIFKQNTNLFIPPPPLAFNRDMPEEAVNDSNDPPAFDLFRHPLQ